MEPPLPTEAPDEAHDEAHDDEHRRACLAAGLFASVAVIQLLGLLRHGLGALRPGVAIPHLTIVLPAAFFAIGIWRGWRLRIGTIAFALLWTAVSVAATVELTRSMSMLAKDGAIANVTLAPASRWLVPLVIARAACFVAAALTLVIGRPGRARLRVGAVLGIAFAVLFLLEQAYPRLT